jgi:DNA-binding transcriptional ArsR family regulator
MENYSISLDSTFHALADPTRRAVVGRLVTGPATVKALAEPFQMGLPSFMKHIKVLEHSGLVSSKKVGRVRTCRLTADRLKVAESWLAEQRELWAASADRLAAFAEKQHSKGKKK